MKLHWFKFIHVWVLFVTLLFIGFMDSSAEEKTKDSVVVSKGTDGLITMENDKIEMVVDPSHGGSVIRFIHKEFGKDVVLPDRGNDQMGLFLDHYWEDGWPWPGEMMPSAYEVVETKSGTKEGILKMRYTLKGQCSGRSDPKVEGLVFEKTLSLNLSVDAVFCNVSFYNPTERTKMVAYWLQNYYNVGGDYDEKKDVFTRPTTRGILRMGRASGSDFIYDFSRGWSGATDTEKNSGLVWLMDYNYLNSLYNFLNNVTQEWVYDRALIPSGKTWRTEIVLLPFFKVKDITFASRNLMAGLNVTREDNKIILSHFLKQGIRQVENARLDIEVMSGTSNKKTSAELKVGTIGAEVKMLKQEISGDIPDPLIVKVTATGDNADGQFQENYWDFYVGGYGYGANVQMDMVTPVYQEKRPEKKQVLLKPDVIRRVQRNILYYAMEGLFSERYCIEEILRLAGQEPAPDGVPTIAEYSLNTYGMGAQISAFPYDYDILMRYDAIIASNVNVDCLGPTGKEMLYDYLTHGGGLLILGGKTAYGAGGWKGSCLEDLLPVKLDENQSDIEKIESGILRKGDPHWITDEIDLLGSPRTEFVHNVAVRDGAETLLYAGENPFLVIWEKNGSRIACMLGTPYGNHEDGKGPLYFSWDKWKYLMKNVLLWLGNRQMEKDN